MSYTNTLRARGVCQGQGLRLFVFFRENERQERGRGHWKVFLFLPDNILWQVLRGEAAGKGAQEVRMKAVWLWVLLWERGRCGPCGWAWQHIGTLPDYATEKFIHFLFTFHDKTTRSSRPPSLSHSLPSSCHHAPFLAATTLCNI